MHIIRPGQSHAVRRQSTAGGIPSKTLSNMVSGFREQRTRRTWLLRHPTNGVALRQKQVTGELRLRRYQIISK